MYNGVYCQAVALLRTKAIMKLSSKSDQIEAIKGSKTKNVNSHTFLLEPIDKITRVILERDFKLIKF